MSGCSESEHGDRRNRSSQCFKMGKILIDRHRLMTAKARPTPYPCRQEAADCPGLAKPYPFSSILTLPTSVTVNMERFFDRMAVINFI